MTTNKKNVVIFNHKYIKNSGGYSKVELIEVENNHGYSLDTTYNAMTSNFESFKSLIHRRYKDKHYFTVHKDNFDRLIKKLKEVYGVDVLKHESNL